MRWLLVVHIESPGAIPAVERVRIGRFRWFNQEWELNGVADVAALDEKLRAMGEPFHEALVNLRIVGAVDLETRERLERLLETWHGRLLHLGEQLDGLIARPSDSDLDRIDIGGFVRTAVNRLNLAEANPLDPDHAYAGDAITLLYRLHMSSGGAQ